MQFFATFFASLLFCQCASAADAPGPDCPNVVKVSTGNACRFDEVAVPCASLGSRLAALDSSQNIDDMNVPGFRLHPLKGTDKGRWSVWVNGNWRLTFDFRDGQAYVLDYEDYH
jgi:plasmid maintenance system killer protein